jgi:spore coat protein U-like protein
MRVKLGCDGVNGFRVLARHRRPQTANVSYSVQSTVGETEYWDHLNRLAMLTAEGSGNRVGMMA